ncbi:UNVERIFIED_CONTAM: hypothetical protein Slati_3736200 [Sesamum latifolium]|uniref:Uncharacterized protein n=1 Tax=Sesamum latifolium TaxID=2727402 RepID=A0AAW2U4N5_9LAMI
MKCILISLPSRSAIALFESPSRILALVSSGVLSHLIFTESSKLNSTSLMKFSQASSRVVVAILNAATHSSINFSVFIKSIMFKLSIVPYGCRGWSMVLAHGECSGTLLGFLPGFSLNLVPTNVGWRWCGNLYSLSLDDPVKDHWNLYFPPAVVVLEWFRWFEH